jgi:hypothetical protein
MFVPATLQESDCCRRDPPRIRRATLEQIRVLLIQATLHNAWFPIVWSGTVPPDGRDGGADRASNGFLHQARQQIPDAE